MRIIVRLLEEQALKCAKEVSLCQTPEAERIMRMLMVDLLITLRAESERIAETRIGHPEKVAKSMADTVSSEPCYIDAAYRLRITGSYGLKQLHVTLWSANDGSGMHAGEAWRPRNVAIIPSCRVQIAVELLT